MTNVTYEDDGSSGKGKTTMETPKHYDPSLDGPDEYTKKTNKRGLDMYYKNGRLVSKLDIPDKATIIDTDALAAQENELLNTTVEHVLPEVNLELSNTECLWQDGPGDHIKFLSGRMVYLCETHYGLTLGKIAHQLQKRIDEA